MDIHRCLAFSSNHYHFHCFLFCEGGWYNRNNNYKNYLNKQHVIWNFFSYTKKKGPHQINHSRMSSIMTINTLCCVHYSQICFTEYILTLIESLWFSFRSLTTFRKKVIKEAKISGGICQVATKLPAIDYPSVNEKLNIACNIWMLFF